MRKAATKAEARARPKQNRRKERRKNRRRKERKKNPAAKNGDIPARAARRRKTTGNSSSKAKSRTSAKRDGHAGKRSRTNIIQRWITSKYFLKSTGRYSLTDRKSVV